MPLNTYTETTRNILAPDGEQVTEVDGHGAWVHTNVPRQMPQSITSPAKNETQNQVSGMAFD